MKKNKMMRLASAMMVMTLMTTSVISGTFAKYVTQDSASDTARVAKFGVVVTAGGTLFAETYKTTVNTPGDGIAEVSVVSTSTLDGDPNTVENVVAPGTKNDEGMTFEITGTPEVDVKVELKVTDKTGAVDENLELKDIFLGKKNALPDMTTGNKTDYFDNTSIYKPVKYTLWQKKSTDPDFVKVTDAVDVDLKTLADKIEGLSEAKYDANTDLAEKFGMIKITWAWDFDDDGAGTYDQQDTLLGDLAAGIDLTPAPAPALVDGTDYNLNTDLKVTVSVTQID